MECYRAEPTAAQGFYATKRRPDPDPRATPWGISSARGKRAGAASRQCGVLTSSRSRPPPSTENPGNAVRMGRSGWPRAAGVGARRCRVPRRCASGRGAGDAYAGPKPERRPQGVAVLGSVASGRGGARQSRLRPGFRPKCGRGVRHAQVQGTTCRPVRLWIWVRKSPRHNRARDQAPYLCGRAYRAHACAHDRTVPPHGGSIRIGLPVGHPARPDALSAPVGLAARDRVPLPVRGRPPTPRGTRLRPPVPRGHAFRYLRIRRNEYPEKMGCRVLG